MKNMIFKYKKGVILTKKQLNSYVLIIIKIIKNHNLN